MSANVSHCDFRRVIFMIHHICAILPLKTKNYCMKARKRKKNHATKLIRPPIDSTQYFRLIVSCNGHKMYRNDDDEINVKVKV